MKVAGFVKKRRAMMGQSGAEFVWQKGASWARWIVCLIGYLLACVCKALICNDTGRRDWLVMQVCAGSSRRLEGYGMGAGGVWAADADWFINALVRMRILAQRVISGLLAVDFPDFQKNGVPARTGGFA